MDINVNANNDKFVIDISMQFKQKCIEDVGTQHRHMQNKGSGSKHVNRLGVGIRNHESTSGGNGPKFVFKPVTPSTEVKGAYFEERKPKR